MKRFEFPVYVIFFLLALWWRAQDDGPGIRTPRAPNLPPGSSQPGPAVPAPSNPGVTGPQYFVEDKDSHQDSIGTAFAIDDDGYWVTARHVVGGCKSLVFLDVNNSRMVRGGPAWIHPNSDMALVRGPRPRTAFRLASGLPGYGTEGFHIGYPRGEPGDVRSKAMGSARMVTRGRHRSDEPIIAYAEVERHPPFTGSLGGMSGGPIFNGAGNIIGVTVAESPRRGRILGTMPGSFAKLYEEAGREPDGTNISTPVITGPTLRRTGDRLRRDYVVAKLVCLVS